jgi:hypothetical protein
MPSGRELRQVFAVGFGDRTLAAKGLHFHPRIPPARWKQGIERKGLIDILQSACKLHW